MRAPLALSIGGGNFTLHLKCKKKTVIIITKNNINGSLRGACDASTLIGGPKAAARHFSVE